MEPPITGYETISRDDVLVHKWRVSQLTRLGIPGPLAECHADHLDWHQVARLVQRGCPPHLALRILRLRQRHVIRDLSGERRPQLGNGRCR